MMRSLSIAIAGILTMLAGAAFAADPMAIVPSESSAINWSGAYLGAVAGYGWNSDHYDFGPPGVDVDSDGFIGGLTAGYNWQRGQIVFGVEGDVSYANIHGSALEVPFVPPCGNEGCTADVDWYGTGRVRVGYAFENFLPYLTGGFAVGKVKGTADLGACGFTPTCGYDETRWGWAAGAGLEWALNQQLSFKAEYMHVDLGTPEFNTPSSVPSTDNIDFDTVRVGINYHF
ncbi:MULTISPECIES: outer membrane protein [unclassified Mesorhizobium]|uniref:outer membrane protein n=1 Tax=unclassified Mesorhizobium TaxID=325217 RepID=UPI003337B9BE